MSEGTIVVKDVVPFWVKLGNVHIKKRKALQNFRQENNVNVFKFSF